jgi:hypothetical protein
MGLSTMNIKKTDVQDDFTDEHVPKAERVWEPQMQYKPGEAVDEASRLPFRLERIPVLIAFGSGSRTPGLCGS